MLPPSVVLFDNRIPYVTNISLSPIIQPHEHLGKVIGNYMDVALVPDIDGSRGPLAEVKHTGARSIQHIDSVWGIVDVNMLVHKYKIFVEKGAVETVPYDLH